MLFSKAYIFSFPFWIYVNTRHAPSINMVNFEGVQIRLYPPFKTSAANWIPMPKIDKEKIPFLRNRRPKEISNHFSISIAPMPLLDGPGADKMGVVVALEEEWPSGKKPVNFPMDALRIDIISKEDREDFGEIAERFVKLLMAQLRVISKQWWIFRSIDSLLGWTRLYVDVDKFGTPTDVPIGTIKIRTPNGSERAISISIWNLAVERVEKNIQPPLYEVLMMDAEFHLATYEIRQFILSASTACEQFKEIVIESIWIKENPGKKYRRGKVLNSYDICRHIDVDLKNICDKSFKVEDEESFSYIKKLWDARGNVAHGEMPYFNSDGQRIEVDEEIAKNMISAARKLVNWLSRLKKAYE